MRGVRLGDMEGGHGGLGGEAWRWRFDRPRKNEMERTIKE
jgi:hypothetical protein